MFILGYFQTQHFPFDIYFHFSSFTHIFTHTYTQTSSKVAISLDFTEDVQSISVKDIK